MILELVTEWDFGLFSLQMQQQHTDFSGWMPAAPIFCLPSLLLSSLSCSLISIQKTVSIRITVTGHLVSQFRIFSITYKTWNAAPSPYVTVGGGEGMYLVKTQFMLFSIVDYHLFKNFLYSNIYNNRIHF